MVERGEKTLEAVRDLNRYLFTSVKGFSMGIVGFDDETLDRIMEYAEEGDFVDYDALAEEYELDESY